MNCESSRVRALVRDSVGRELVMSKTPREATRMRRMLRNPRKDASSSLQAQFAERTSPQVDEFPHERRFRKSVELSHVPPDIARAPFWLDPYDNANVLRVLPQVDALRATASVSLTTRLGISFRRYEK